MKEITRKMIKIYKMDDICWMGYKVSICNPYTFHHLKRNSDGGEAGIKNGAILSLYAHDYLHIIENCDIERYVYLNNILKIINAQNIKPSKQQLITIDELLKAFEREYGNAKNRQGKDLIKKKYYNRIYYKR